MPADYLHPQDRENFAPYGTSIMPDAIDNGPMVGGGTSILDILADVSNQLAAFGAGPSVSNSMHGPAAGIIRPAWIPDPQRVVNPVTGKSQVVDPLDNPNFDVYFGAKDVEGDERVFMGKYVRVDADEEDVALQAGTDVSRSTIRGLQGTDDPFTSEAPTKAGPRKKDVKKDQTITVDQALARPYMWSEKRIEQVMGKMREAGWEVTDFDEMRQVWEAMVTRSSMIYGMSKGKRDVTPWDVLEMYKNERKGSGFFGGQGEEQGFTGVKTQTHRDVTKISEGDAWSALRSTVSGLLGRDPTDQEVRDFTYRMNSLAAENPSITKSSTRYKNGEAKSSRTRVVEPGMTANDMARAAYDDAQEDPDYGAYQAASTYMNLLLSELGPTV